ncbi:MAG TPA: hypothetical protein VHZ24_20910 [Pirellulales bacterium]|nr:hypothetical protein [Pirellulales bacterium]
MAALADHEDHDCGSPQDRVEDSSLGFPSAGPARRASTQWSSTAVWSTDDSNGVTGETDTTMPSGKTLPLCGTTTPS